MSWRLIAFTLPFISLLGVGCDPGALIGQKIAETVVESAIEKNINAESGKDVDVDVSGNALRVVGENGEVVAFGERVTISADFPSDVPVYPGAIAKSSSLSKNNTQAALVLSTTDGAVTVRDWYKRETIQRGWTQSVSLELESQNYVLGYKMEKDEQILMLSVNIVPSNDESKETAIVVSRSVQE